MKKEPAVITELRKKEDGLINDARKLVESYPRVPITVDCVIFGFDENELKVLLIHKNNMKSLLASIPVVNRNYFALDDIAVPRVNVRTTIDTYPELNAAFNDALTVKEEIKNKFLGRLSRRIRRK